MVFLNWNWKKTIFCDAVLKYDNSCQNFKEKMTNFVLTGQFLTNN